MASPFDTPCFSQYSSRRFSVSASNLILKRACLGWSVLGRPDGDIAPPPFLSHLYYNYCHTFCQALFIFPLAIRRFQMYNEFTKKERDDNMGDQFLALLALFTVFLLPFLLEWVPYRSRMSVPEGCVATPGAKIVDVSVKPVGNSKTRRLKTVVFFSDGTQYITFKSNNTPGLLSTHMVVDKETLLEIFQDALASHKKYCASRKSS